MNKVIGQVDVSIVIPSYNTKELLLACIESISETTKKVPYEIIVVDNASTDNTVEEIRNSTLRLRSGREFEIRNKIKIIMNRENVGFSRANNQGVKEASGRYVLFLNADTLAYEKTIDGMVKFMDQNESAGAATCYVELPNGYLDDSAHRGFPTPWRALCHFSHLSKLFINSRFLNGYHLGYQDLDKVHEIEACAGAFMIVRREAGEQIGWWDEDFFWYGDDLDFCYRLKEYGWKIYFVPQFKILHYKGVSGGIKKISKHLTKADYHTKKRATQSRFEAMKMFYDKHYKNKYPKLLNLFITSSIRFKGALTHKINGL